MRKRPNHYENRYNQLVIAGKIAINTGAINPYIGGGSSLKIANIYRTNDGKLHYFVIGQVYLRKLKIKITEL